MGLSLWLVPSQDVAAKLHRVMQTRTPTSTSPASFPPFAPHVTLASAPSDTPLAELRAALPRGQRAVPVRFRALGVGAGARFGAVYVGVHHAGALGVLRESLTARFGAHAVPPEAHLSLCYVDNAELEERAGVVERLRCEGRVVEKAGESVVLNCGERPEEAGEDDVVRGFDGVEIWTVLCDGPVPGWEVMDRMKLEL